MTVGVRIYPKNMPSVLSEVRKLAGDSEDAIFNVILDLTLGTHKRAVRGIQRGPASGRVYRKYNPKRTHRASAVGEYPMSDTGRLAASVLQELPKKGPKPVGQVYTNLRYGKYLELKPAALGGRPWLLRAFREATKQVLADLRAEFSKRRGNQ